jgi:hypothetical protein
MQASQKYLVGDRRLGRQTEQFPAALIPDQRARRGLEIKRAELRGARCESQAFRAFASRRLVAHTLNMSPGALCNIVDECQLVVRPCVSKFVMDARLTR